MLNALNWINEVSTRWLPALSTKLLLALAKIVILGSEFHEAHDHFTVWRLWERSDTPEALSFEMRLSNIYNFNSYLTGNIVYPLQSPTV
jgi:hypothetical protein